MDSLTMLKQWRASTTKASCATIASTINEEDEDGDGDDQGPFIDLEFSVPPDEDSCKDSDDTAAAAAAAAAAALRALETSSLVFSTAESNSKPQFAVSLLKSATKFRVFMLGSKKPKTSASSPKHQLHNDNKKMLVRFKVEEVPLMSLFTRDTSSKNNNSESIAAAAGATDDKKFSKEVLQKYLSKIKRLRFSGQVGSVSSVSKPGSDGDAPPSGLKTVNRRLGKSRSASATVAAVRSPPRRRDDSLLQQQDGIQSAIAHCKRSFNAEKAPELPLVRSNSDPGNGRQETCKAETKVDLH